MTEPCNWEAMRTELINILRDAERYPSEKSCFFSAYQLAVLLYQKNKKLIKNSNCPKNIGGIGEGSYNSLSQYIAVSLSRDIENDIINEVEIAFFNTVGLEQFSFRDEKNRLSEPSNTCFSMFRYINTSQSS